MKRDKDPADLSDQHNARGIELADRGWLDEAVKEFKRAIELDPASAPAHDNLATVYAEQQKLREALEEHLTAVRLDPSAPTARFNLACFLANHGETLALAEYRETLAIDPVFPDAQLNLGLTLADAGKLEEAGRALRAAIEQEPADPVPRHELAALLMDDGDFRAAIAQLKEVTRLEPANFDAWLDLGISYAQKGFYAEAERAYASAAGLRPDDLLLNYNLAALHALWGQPEAAIAALRHALSVDPAKVRGWLETDRMFEPIEKLPAFIELLRG